MTLKSLIAGHVASAFLRTDHFAESATYTAPGGAPVALSAVFGDERVEELDELVGGGRRIHRRTITAFIGKNPVASCGGVVTPQVKATVTRGSELWAVEAIEVEDEAAATLRLVFRGLTDGPTPRFGG